MYRRDRGGRENRPYRGPRNDYREVYPDRGDYDGPYNRRGGGRKRDSRGRFTSEYDNGYYPPYMNERKRKIGFNREEDMSPRYYEDEEQFDEDELGYMLDEIPDYLPDYCIEDWVKGMENIDGSQKGGHWTREQIRKVYEEHKVKEKTKGEVDEEDFYVVMNMLYSDYAKALKENGANSLQLYVALAIAFLLDEDAPENKLARYYYCVVNG